MHFAKDDTTKLIRQYTDEIKRTVVAFANTKYGEIFIGVENDGNISGVEDTDNVCLQVITSCRNSISPDNSFQYVL